MFGIFVSASTKGSFSDLLVPDGDANNTKTSQKGWRRAADSIAHASLECNFSKIEYN